MFLIKRVSTSIIAASVALALGGCKTLDPYTGEQKTSNTAKSSAIGAGIGALIGYLSAKDKSRRDKRKAILIGAGVGGLTGAAVGNYMDKQEDELRQQLQGSGVSVTRNGDELILNMPGNITFATNSAELKPSFYDVLDSVVLVLKKFDKTLIEVAGHTDATGSAQYNKKLSYQRAQSVTDYLVGKNVDPQRVITVGHGEERPIASNKTPEGRQQNRRVELTLIPIKANG